VFWQNADMTDTQVYFAIGVPVILNLLALLWQSRAVEKTLGARIDSLEKVMLAKFEAVDARFEAAHQGRVEGVMDARLHALESRGR
jgi:citrate lyase gamma subunit